MSMLVHRVIREFLSFKIVVNQVKRATKIIKSVSVLKVTTYLSTMHLSSCRNAYARNENNLASDVHSMTVEEIEDVKSSIIRKTKRRRNFLAEIK